MDGAILVVSAADGIMPQTREHVLLAKQVSPSTPAHLFIGLACPSYVLGGAVHPPPLPCAPLTIHQTTFYALLHTIF